MLTPTHLPGGRLGHERGCIIQGIKLNLVTPMVRQLAPQHARACEGENCGGGAGVCEQSNVTPGMHSRVLLHWPDPEVCQLAP